jgi:hypothetical protein
MSEISRASLFGKLNSLGYKAIEGATVFCKLRGNPYVELVHWIQQILQTPDSDIHRIVRHFEIDSSRLAKDVTDALDRLPRGASSISDLSEHVERAVERGWVYATLMFGEPRVRTGHLMIGMLKTPSLRNVELTGPYFHTGGAATLEQVVEFYARNGDVPAGGNLGPGMGNIRLNAQERSALVAFYGHIMAYIAAPELQQLRLVVLREELQPSGALDGQPDGPRRMHDDLTRFLCRTIGIQEPDLVAVVDQGAARLLFGHRIMM